MILNRLWLDVGSAVSYGAVEIPNEGFALYIVQSPFKGSGPVEQWSELILIPSATTFDAYTVMKDSNDIVPGSYVATLDIANASFPTYVQSLGGHCFFMSLTDDDASAIQSAWV